MRRVVITGIGAVTPLGNTIESTWENLKNKVSGISHITKFDPSGMPSKIAGELKNFHPENYVPPKDIFRLDPFIHYATVAAHMAAQDAGIGSADLQKSKSASVIGSSRGGITSMERALENNLVRNKPFSAYLMSATTINMASSYISITLGIKGPSLGISTACASGSHAIGEAMRMIRYAEADIAVAGGAEAPLCRLAAGGYAASGALSRMNNEPQKASRPFDIRRDGFVISEGAGILVLEELDHALKRGARIYAELAGYGTSSDAFHQTQPDSNGESRAIIQALYDAKITGDDVDYINAHATSTPLGDSAEARAIREVFGGRFRDIHVSSCKSMLGHMLGAAGAVEAAISALSIHRATIIPTINLEDPDPACDLKHVTSLTKAEINIAVTNSFGFGGTNAVLVLKRFVP